MASGKARTAKPRTIGQMLRDARERKGEDGKPMPKTEAVRALGIGGRQTYYHWEDDYVTPSLEHAQMIAEFTDQPVEVIVNEILRSKGLRTYDEYLKMKSRSQQATLRARSTGTIPGLFSRPVPGMSRMRGSSTRGRLNIQSSFHGYRTEYGFVPSLGLQ